MYRVATLFLLVFPTPLHAQPPAPNPTEATYKVWSAEGGGSATCVWVENGKSVLLGCNHVFAVQPAPGTAFPLANYPRATLVHSMDGKQTFNGTAIGGSVECDLAVIVVEGVLHRAELGTTDPPVGTEVWHRGATSKFTKGTVQPVPWQSPQPCNQFASTCGSVSGDSGAGVLTGDGKWVALQCGRVAIEANALQRGTPVSQVRPVLRKVVGERFPELSKTLAK